jgi:hypothetical protein
MSLDLSTFMKNLSKHLPEKEKEARPIFSLLQLILQGLDEALVEKIIQAVSNRDTVLTGELNLFLADIQLLKNNKEELLRFLIELMTTNLEDVDADSNSREFITQNNWRETLLSDNLSVLKPRGFRISGGEIIRVETWQELFIKSCQLFIRRDAELMHRLAHDLSIHFLKTNSQGMRMSKLLERDLFLETAYNGVETGLHIQILLKNYKIALGNFRLYVE